MRANDAPFGRPCPDHPAHPTEFACLDPSCRRARPGGCALCVKGAHAKCRDEFVVEPAEFAARVEVLRASFDAGAVTRLVAALLHARLDRFFGALGQKQAEFLDSLRLDARRAPPTPRLLGALKRNFRVEAGEGGVVRVGSKLVLDEASLQQAALAFDRRLEGLFRQFGDEFGKVSFAASAGGQLRDDQFSCHPAIELENEGQGVRVGRRAANVGLEYFCAAANEPLPDHALLRLTVLGINAADRFLDFGVAAQAKRDAIAADDFKNSFASGAVSFCGYSFTGGLGGATRSSSSSDALANAVGDVHYLEYSKGGLLAIYNDDRSNNLSATLPEGEDHFFFVVLYHPEAACLVERLG